MAIYQTYRTLVRKLAENTYAYHFARPSGFDFVAGQFIRVTLIHTNEPDAKATWRDFSLASSPDEDDLVIALRYRDSFFKKELHSIHDRQLVQIEGPLGTLHLHEDHTVPAVFISGGIGVAPFRSMLFSSFRHSSPHRIHLFAANPTARDAAYGEDFEGMSRRYPFFSFIPILTRGDIQERWNGERGYLTAEKFTRYLSDVSKPMYYIVGPVKMVMSVKKTLREMNVPNEQIIFEIFTGY